MLLSFEECFTHFLFSINVITSPYKIAHVKYVFILYLHINSDLNINKLILKSYSTIIDYRIYYAYRNIIKFYPVITVLNCNCNDAILIIVSFIINPKICMYITLYLLYQGAIGSRQQLRVNENTKYKLYKTNTVFCRKINITLKISVA